MELTRVIRKGFELVADSDPNEPNTIVIADCKFSLGKSYPSPQGDAGHINSGYGICAEHPRIPGTLFSLFAYPDCISYKILLTKCLGAELVTSSISLLELGAVAAIKHIQEQVNEFLLSAVCAMSPIDW